MAQTEKSTPSATSNSFAANFSKAGQKQVEAISAMQADVFKELQEMGEYWTARAKSETDLASELLGKLTNARSIPETATAYQEWAIRRAALHRQRQAHGDSRTALFEWRRSRFRVIHAVDERGHEDIWIISICRALTTRSDVSTRHTLLQKCRNKIHAEEIDRGNFPRASAATRCVISAARVSGPGQANPEIAMDRYGRRS
jgi:Phasin protein